MKNPAPARAVLGQRDFTGLLFELINDGPPGEQLSLRLPPARAYTRSKPMIVFSQIAHDRPCFLVGKALKNFAHETEAVASRVFTIGRAYF